MTGGRPTSYERFAANPSNALGARLAEARRRRAMSAVTVAQQLAPHDDVQALARRVLRLEQGKRLDLLLAQRLARLYGTTLAALVADTPPEQLALRILSRLSARNRIRVLRCLRDVARAANARR